MNICKRNKQQDTIKTASTILNYTLHARSQKMFCLGSIGPGKGIIHLSQLDLSDLKSVRKTKKDERQGV